MRPVDCLPFNAVHGLEQVKRSIISSMINPRVRTVLVTGVTGTAKSVLIRSVSSVLEDSRIINVPMNVSEDHLIGGLDVENSLMKGSNEIRKGILSNAHENVLCIDDINLMDPDLALMILNCIESEEVRVERERVSFVYPLKTTLLATSGPEGMNMSSHILDRFDICVQADSHNRTEDRKEILSKNLDFQKCPTSFNGHNASKESDQKQAIAKSMALLPHIKLPEEMLELAVHLSNSVGITGLRGHLSLVSTAQSIAALNDHLEIQISDLEEAAKLCLPHRASRPPPAPPSTEEIEDEVDDNESHKDDTNNDEDPRNNEAPRESPKDEEREDHHNEPSVPQPEETVFDIEGEHRTPDGLFHNKKRLTSTNSRKGRRDVAISMDGTGRYTRSRIPESRCREIALDATIRAAVPFQSRRERGEMAISLASTDIREKVRERRSGCTIMFLVDASGSLGARRRMASVKGAINSMLQDSYLKRDRIGLMAFRDDDVVTLLPPTKSVEYSRRCLEEMPTGGRTPLAKALIESSSFMSTYSRTHQGEACHIVLVTDGRGNIPYEEGQDVNSELINVSEKLAERINWVVIDAGKGGILRSDARPLAEALSADYFRLDDFNADVLATRIRLAVD